MPGKTQFFTKTNIITAAFLLILGGLLWLLFSLLQPFIPAFFWALILAMVFYPLYRRCLRLLKSRSAAAFVSTLVVLAIFVLPVFVLLVNLGGEAGNVYQSIADVQWADKGKEWVEKIQSWGLMERLNQWGIRSNVVDDFWKDTLAFLTQDLGKFVLSKLNGFLQNLFPFLAQVFFALLTLFFFFRDGERYAGTVVEFLPLPPARRREVVERFAGTVSSVVRAMFFTALAQGVLTGLGFWAAGVPFPMFWGLVTSVASFIPIFGASLVWLPASLWLLSQGHGAAAVALALWGVSVVSLVDSWIKPKVIGSESRLPMFLVFFTILGGLNLYGFLGVFLGPLILSMGLAFLNIYREEYLKKKSLLSVQKKP